MICRKCNINPSSICLHLHTKICIKRFLKSFQKKIKWLPNIGYLFYKRPKISDQKNDPYIDNRWVVSHNLYLPKKYNAHINVEGCSFIKVIIYLYKYVCKNYNVVDIFITPQFKKNYDKISKFHMPQ